MVLPISYGPSSLDSGIARWQRTSWPRRSSPLYSEVQVQGYLAHQETLNVGYQGGRFFKCEVPLYPGISLIRKRLT